MLIETKPIRYRENPYLNYGETALLVELVRRIDAETMIEFGVQTGRTAMALLNNVPTLRRYIGIDVPPDHRATLRCQQTEIPRLAGCYASDDPRFELIIRPRGSLDLNVADLPECDAAFIDGDHGAEAVAHDSKLARERVRAGGLIVWHDYGNPAVEVTPVIDRLSREGWPVDSINGSWLAFMVA